MNYRIAALIFVPFIGAGCFAAPAPQTAVSKAEPLCLAWSNTEGFRAWTEAYATGDQPALDLAKTVHLPAKANEKLIADLRASLDAGGAPSFLCTLDTEGKNITWVMENPDSASGNCANKFYVSIDGEGTVTDFTTTERSKDCKQLCKPKRLEESLLVWQCDLREAEDKKASWSQIHMDRKTGVTEIHACQEDGLGLPLGCLR